MDRINNNAINNNFINNDDEISNNEQSNNLNLLARASSFNSVPSFRSESLLSLTASEASTEINPVYTRQFSQLIINTANQDNENINVGELITFFTDTRNVVSNVSSGLVSELIFAQMPQEQFDDIPQSISSFLRGRLLPRQIVRFFYHNRLFGNRAIEFTQNLRDEILQTPNYRHVLYSSIRRELEYTDSLAVRDYLRFNDPEILVENIEENREVLDQILNFIDPEDFQ